MGEIPSFLYEWSVIQCVHLIGNELQTDCRPIRSIIYLSSLLINWRIWRMIWMLFIVHIWFTVTCTAYASCSIANSKLEFIQIRSCVGRWTRPPCWVLSYGVCNFVNNNSRDSSRTGSYSNIDDYLFFFGWGLAKLIVIMTLQEWRTKSIENKIGFFHVLTTQFAEIKNVNVMQGETLKTSSFVK